MLILIDLDGTITHTVHPSWKPYKDGYKNYNIEEVLDQIHFIEGARDFLERQQKNGNSILIVSDSHPKYVEPISKYLGVDCLSLADKPNIIQLSLYLDSHPSYKKMVEAKDCILIGDTALDIELGRRLEIPTIWITPYKITKDIEDPKDKVGYAMESIKTGPTYHTKSFLEIEEIIANPINNLYAIESSFAGGKSAKAIRYGYNKFSDKSYSVIRCLARQESGSCDKNARADKYYAMSSPNRSQDLLETLVQGINNYINQSSLLKEGWDYITYLTDKQTTIPQNKMKEIFDLIKTDIPKVQLIQWHNNVNGSLRHKPKYDDRKDFLKQYLYINAVDSSCQEDLGKKLNIKDKNIIVIDDQLTTSATAWYVIHELKAKGAKNILFIALFQMIIPVESNIVCPHCGKPMQIKIRHSDGTKFYSCVSPKFGGTGCGHTIPIIEQ